MRPSLGRSQRADQIIKHGSRDQKSAEYSSLNPTMAGIKAAVVLAIVAVAVDDAVAINEVGNKTCLRLQPR